MLRQRKNKRYNEESNDDHDERGRTYNLRDKIRCERFEQLEDLQELPGESITLKWIQRNGFEKPILVKNPSGLDLRVPPKGFVVRDVGKLVGNDRMIDVMDVITQKNIEMSMKDWCKYYESRNRDRLLNVISLEFSHTDLDNLVDSPKIVKLLDWVDLVWPKFLKESQTESTNTIDKMKYPKVQKYCLMSVKGSYTDFHIDFGGTSVWYHILRGKKIFWMCPPTELNLQAFEEWTLSGFQQDIFFGDTVEKCFRVELCAGNTFFIPSGWIHAVYTLEDSLVFGGNFLHSFGIENQLKVSRIEDATKVPLKFRYPFYTEMLWYVVQHYVFCLTGKSHLHDIAKNSATITPEKSHEQHREEVMTESEQDESDTKKKKTTLPRKRGRPPKSVATKRLKKPPTDDESTEIDSDLEDVKPTKNATTCRMTKNSLLRLQYEIEDTHTVGASKAVKSGSSTDKPEAKSPTKQSAIPQPNAASTETINKITLSDLTPDSAKTNGWALGQSCNNKSIWSNRDSQPEEPLKIHITKYEVNGLKLLVKYLSKLSGVKKNLPTLIRNSRILLDDCKKVIAEHENDDPEMAATGIPIGPDLLNSKKSDMNHLIDQFFKPSETVSSDSPLNSNPQNSLPTKSDSSTLTHQLRLKYNQTAESNDEKKSTSSDITNSKASSPRKEIKVSSPSKKFLTSLPPSLTSTAAATSFNSLADQPRPKSPPTRPLSNKQYTSRTKQDNSLTLPGSFADLIAATSTAKEVFEVSSTDVTSTLFGLKLPPPNKKVKERTSSTESASKSNFNHDRGTVVNNAGPPSGSSTASKELSPKPVSPEPPKICPPKRFINPAYKPQNKEKLIFASAPYVSPVSVSGQSKSTGLYPWQSPVTVHPPQNQPPYQQCQYQRQRQNITSVLSPKTNPPKESAVQTHPAIKQEEIQGVDKVDCTASLGHTETNLSTPREVQNSEVSSSMDAEAKVDLQPKNEATASTTDLKSADSDPISNSSRDSSLDNNAPHPHASDSVEHSEMVRPVKIRGPPKKSKEARLVLSLDTPETSTSVIQLNSGAKPTSVIQSGSSRVAEPSLTLGAANDKRNEKEKPKPKRAKKPKDDKDQANESVANQNAKSANQSRPPVICGLVTSPMNLGPGVASTSSKMNSQQYLISRPLLLNSMPAFSAQQAPKTSMPMFTTSVPGSLGIPNMQQGARVVWASRPGGLPIVSTASALPSSATTSTTQAISKAQKATPSASVSASEQLDNTALLSLATTALSTAPMSTTPTLSHISGQIPSVSQALMVNPLTPGQQTLFAGQQLFSPFIPRMPIVQLASRAVSSEQVVTGTMPRAGVARSGQLLFAPLPNQTGQPRYLITQPGFLPQRPLASPLFVGNQPRATMAYATFPPVVNPAKDAVKVKKVKTS